MREVLDEVGDERDGSADAGVGGSTPQASAIAPSHRRRPSPLMSTRNGSPRSMRHLNRRCTERGVTARWLFAARPMRPLPFWPGATRR